MGTMIQQYKLGEEDFRDASFADVKGDLKGNNDILSITRPDIIEDIHRSVLRSRRGHGRDQHLFQHHHRPGRLRTRAPRARHQPRAAKLARKVADEISEKENRPTFVAGAIGPTNRTASMSPDVNRPEYRAASYDELYKAYYEQDRSAR